MNKKMSINYLLEIIAKTPVFGDIEKQKEEIDIFLLKTLNSTVKEPKANKQLLNAIKQACQIYQVNGYLKGINQKIISINTLNSKQVQVYDTSTRERII